MKKDSNQNPWRQEPSLVIGMDLGDKHSQACVKTAYPLPLRLCKVGSPRSRRRSPWVSRLLEQIGHQVIVVNPRRLKLISDSDSKNDPADARMLARVAAAMPDLLKPVKHRSAEAQQDLTVIRSRAKMVEARTKLWLCLRGLSKSLGRRLPRRVTRESLAEWREILEPLWNAIEDLRTRIAEYDRKIELLLKKYPAAVRLQQISGVGALISLTFVLTLDDPQRFQRSRQVGGYLGLRPRQRDSGASQPQLRITKAGDGYLRSLLIQGAHYILGKFAPDTDLRRWGLKLAGRGGKNAKKRAVVAVARKLAVLMHRLWTGQSEYQPLRRSELVEVK